MSTLYTFSGAFFGFTILKYEMSFDVKSFFWQCIYRQ